MRGTCFSSNRASVSFKTSSSLQDASSVGDISVPFTALLAATGQVAACWAPDGDVNCPGGTLLPRGSTRSCHHLPHPLLWLFSPFSEAINNTRKLCALIWVGLGCCFFFVVSHFSPLCFGSFQLA